MTHGSRALQEGRSQCCVHSEGEGSGHWRFISQVLEHMEGGAGRETGRKRSRTRLGKAANPVSLSKPFGGVIGSESEKICRGKFTTLDKNQKPTPVCVRDEAGLSYKVVSWKPKGRTKVGGETERPSISPFPCHSFSRASSLLEGAAEKESRPSWESKSPRE